MHKLFPLLLVILCTSLNLNAQNSKEKYDKAVDYCACKIAYAYTNQYISNGRAESYNQNEFDKEKKAFESIIKNELEKCKIEEHIGFDDLNILLSNNNFKDLADKLEDVVEESKKVNIDSINKQQAIKNILDGFYNNEDFNKIVLKYSTVKELKSSLETDLNNILKSFEEQALSIEDNEPITTSESNLTNEINHSDRVINEGSVDTSENSFLPNWLLFAIILLASILLFLNNHLKIKKLKESAKRHRDEIENLKDEKSIFNQSNNISQNNSRFERDVKQKISDLKIAMERLQNSNTISSSSSEHKISKVKNISQPKPSEQKRSQVKSISQSKPKENQKIVFAKAPNEKGEFKSSDVNENKDGKYYKFTLINNNEAQFEFFNAQNNAIQAVDSPEIFLFPVNDSGTALNQNAKRIITNKSGIAIKQENKWIVKEKAQITYE